jgi:abequosyltransferase
MILTIAIPTYNRPEKVKNTVLRLIPQLGDHAQIMVIDNCSDVIIKDYLQQSIPNLESEKVIIIRNKTNVGADGNFLKCFELCDTPYIWMLGDDDKPEKTAVQLIMSELKVYKDEDLIGINFKSNLINRDAPIIIRSTKEFAEKLDDFGNWSFISTSIYKTEAFNKFLYTAMWGAYGMSSQLIPTMMAVSKGKTFVLSEKYLVTNVPIPGKSQDWSIYQFALSLSSILEANVGFKKDEYRAFGAKLDVHFSCIFPADVMYTIIKSVDYNIDLIDNYHVYIYNQIILKTWEFRTRKAQQKKQYYICLFLLKNPSALKALCSVVPKIMNKAKQFPPFYLFQRDIAS